MTKQKITLRQFINELEKLSEGGKYDNVEVRALDNDDLAMPLGWFGIDTVYPQDEIDENNPIHGEKMLIIQI